MAGNTCSNTHDELLTKLNFSFGHIFDLEILNCVASEMHWDETKSIEALQLLCGEMKIPSTNEEAFSKDVEGHQPKLNIGNTVLKSAIDNEYVEKKENSFGSNFDLASVELLNQPYDFMSPPEKAADSAIKSRQFDVDRFERVNYTAQDKKYRGISNEQKMCSSSNIIIDNIQYSIMNGVKIMIVMRGCPGSGKSTLARSIIKSTLGNDFKQFIFSTDDFFVRAGRGQFTFNPALLSEAHTWNQQRVLDAVKKGKSPIIVDNTNLELWEMKPYVSMAVTHGYLVELLEPFTAWRYNVGELSKKNIHNVPRQHIKNMMDRFLKNIDSSTLLQQLRINYSPSKMPPQFVKCPPVSHQRKSNRTRTRRQKVPKKGFGDVCHSTSESERESEIFLPGTSKLEYSDQNCETEVLPEVSDISSCYDHFSEINTMNDLPENVSQFHNSEFMETLITPSVSADIREHSPRLTNIEDERYQLYTDESFVNVWKIESPTRFQNNIISSELNLNDYCCQEIDGFVKEGKCTSFKQVDAAKFDECQMAQYDKVDMSTLEPPTKSCTDKCIPKNNDSIVKNMSFLEQLDVQFEEHKDSNLDTELKSSHKVNDGTTKSDETEACTKLCNLKLDDNNTLKFGLGAANYEDTRCVNERDVFNESVCETHTKSQELKFKENVESQLDQAELEDNVQCCDFPILSVDSNASSNIACDTLNCSVTQKNNFTDSQNVMEKCDDLEKESNDNLCNNNNLINSLEVDKKIIGRKENSYYHGTAGFKKEISSAEENCVSNEVLEVQKIECLDEDKFLVENLSTDFDKDQKIGIQFSNNSSVEKCISAKDTSGLENTKEVYQYSLSPNDLKTTLKNSTCNLKNTEDIATENNESLDLIQESFEIIDKVADDNLVSEREEDCQSSSKIKDINEYKSKIMVGKLSTSLELPDNVRNMDLCQQTIDFDTRDYREVKTDVSEKTSDSCSVEMKKNIGDKFKLDTNVEEKVYDWASDDKLYNWDSCDKEDKSSLEKKIFTPRPARTSRRPLLVNRGIEDQNNFQPKPEFVPKELEMWGTVENPLASWEENVTKLSVESVGSNTHHSDFITLHKLNNGEAIDPMKVKVINSSSEQQMAQNKTSTSYVAKIPKRVMLDKSTMTNIEEHFSRGLEELSSVFPNISQEYLKEIYDYCNGDFIWTVDLIMEQGPQHSDNFIPLAIKPGEGVTPFNGKLKSDKVNNASPKKVLKKSRNKFSSEESQELKKQLERNFVINDDYYSDHTLFLRNIRHPENLMQINLEEFQMPGEVQVDMQINPEEFQIHSDVQVDDFPCSSEDTSEEEGIDMKLDIEFVKKLCTLFDGPSLSINDVGPTLKIPKSLAVQIYYLLMEQRQSLLEQEKQKMIKEDEAFAKQLEESSCATETVPNLREIMDMEMAMALYKTDQSQWKMESMETLAIKLSKNLLCETFPNFPRDVLLDIFSAHNYSFNDTIEVLLASSDDTQVHEVMTPEALREHNQRLLQNAIQESKNGTCQNETTSQQDTKLSTENANTLYQVYKDEANRHYNLRKECLKKANDAFRRGLPQVASYYSQVATLHKKHMMEASEQSTHHFFPNKLSSTTLDLHYMFVAEALRILDVFIDSHLIKLNQSANRKKVVYIITGRGQHSIGARSRIKPAVSSRLSQRKLSFIEVNEGFLKVILRRGTNTYTQ